MRHLIFDLLIVCALGFILCSHVAADDWPQDNHDAAHSGYTADDPGASTNWTYQWSFNGPDSSGGISNHLYDAPREARTVSANGTLFVPAGANGLYALSLNSGTVLWHSTVTSFNAAPAYYNSVLYAGGSDGKVYQFAPSTGLVLATYNAGSPVKKALLVANGYLYAVSDNAVLHKINPTTMLEVWAYTPPGAPPVGGPPAYSAASGLIVYATNDMFVHAVNESNGTAKWRVNPTPYTTGFPNQFADGWPVIADQHGLVLLRLRISHEAIMGSLGYPSTGHIFPTDQTITQNWLAATPSSQNLFALSLTDGSKKFIPAVGYGSTEGYDPQHSTSGGAYGEMGSQPVVKVWPNGDEVAYINFRNGSASGLTDGDWDGQMGEMMLDNTTNPSLPAGQLRFMKTSRYNGYGGGGYDYINDEQTPITLSGNTLFYSHWSAVSSHQINTTSRNNDSVGLIYTNPIGTTVNQPIIRALSASGCSDKNSATHKTSCTNLNYVTDGGRYYGGPGWWVYWNVADPPGWRLGSGNTAGTAYSAGFLPRYTYTTNGYLIAEGNGGDLSVFTYPQGSVTPTPTPITSATPSPVPAPPTGDFNNDGKIDYRDFLLLIPRFGLIDSLYKLVSTPTLPVNIFDFNYLLSHLLFAAATPTPTISVGPSPTPVPAPPDGAFVRAGTGVADSIPHQIVRAQNGNVYLFSASLPGSTTLKTYYAPGFPTNSTSFTPVQTTLASPPIALTSTYDGDRSIVVAANLQNGTVIAVPFDTQTNTFKSPTTLASDSSHQYTDIGTEGVSAAFDQSTPPELQLVYWSSTNSIKHLAATYNSAANTFTVTSPAVQVNGAESTLANHPVLAVSPLNNSLLVAWVNGTDGAGNLYSRSRTAAGTWSSILKVNAADVWTSPNTGLNIDQSPSVVITADGTAHLAYIENWRISSPYDYGRVHYCTISSGSTSWTDVYTNTYTHDPALASDSQGNLTIFGHGYPLNTAAPAGCQDVNNLCYITKAQGSNTWSAQKLIQTATTVGSTTYGFDASVSTKWSTVGWNAPDSLEFAAFSTDNNSYYQTSLWYGRL